MANENIQQGGLTELQKLELKRALEIQGGYVLSDDSLTGEVINPEFQAIDKGMTKQRIQAGLNRNRSNRDKYYSQMEQEFKTGRKITLMGF